MATFLQIQTRFLVLADESTITTAHKSHINSVVQDIINARPFSWNIKSGTVTLSSGSGDLPSDYNPRWGIEDARVVNTGNVDDVIFTQIPISFRDSYGSSDPKFWITYNTTTSKYVFNSTYDDATVTVYYHFIPSDLSADNDVCIIPDIEAVAKLARNKNFETEDPEDPANAKRAYDFENIIKQLYQQDLNFSDIDVEYSLMMDQDSITTRGV